MLNETISHELKIIELRRTLLKQQDYSLRAVLNSLDAHAHDFVSPLTVLRFLKNYAIQASK